jgi:hypothetical protein
MGELLATWATLGALFGIILALAIPLVWLNDLFEDRS